VDNGLCLYGYYTAFCLSCLVQVSQEITYSVLYEVPVFSLASHEASHTIATSKINSKEIQFER